MADLVLHLGPSCGICKRADARRPGAEHGMVCPRCDLNELAAPSPAVMPQKRPPTTG